MGVFTFVCRSSGDAWSGKQLKGDLEASAGSTYELQRKLVQVALSSDSSGGVQSSFSLITPASGVFQGPVINLEILRSVPLPPSLKVVIGGGGGTFIGGGGAAAAAPAGGAPAAEAPPAEEKKAEKEEESDDDMGFSLFD